MIDKIEEEDIQQLRMIANTDMCPDNCDFCTISGFTTKNIDCKTVAKIVLKGIELVQGDSENERIQ